jgi:hypothetical protein
MLIVRSRSSTGRGKLISHRFHPAHPAGSRVYAVRGRPQQRVKVKDAFCLVHRVSRQLYRSNEDCQFSNMIRRAGLHPHKRARNRNPDMSLTARETLQLARLNSALQAPGDSSRPCPTEGIAIRPKLPAQAALDCLRSALIAYNYSVGAISRLV